MAVTATNNDQSALLASLNGASGSSAAKGKVAEMEDRFLKLLVTQLRNQDPMNPMENAELTTQLAQMSTVEGINKLNASVQSLLQGYQSSQTMQAASLIGRQVLVDGDAIDLNGGLGAAAMELKGAADKVTVKILNDYGQEVRSLDLGPKSEGMVQFIWDGKSNTGQSVADGNYWFTVEAARAGNYVDATPLAVASVRSVLLTDGNVELDTAGLGPRQLSQVRQIF